MKRGEREKEERKEKDLLFFWEEKKRTGFHGFLKDFGGEWAGRSDCNRDWLGILLVTLHILTHISIPYSDCFREFNFCCLVWTVRATSCSIEIDCLLVCHILVFLMPLMPSEKWFMYESIFDFDHILFMFKFYYEIVPLFLAHGLTLGMRLFMFVNWHPLFTSPRFYCAFIHVFCSPFHSIFQSLSVYLGVHWGNDWTVDMKDKVCSNHSMFSVLLVVLFLYLHESHCSLSSFVRLCVNGLKLGYWMAGSEIFQ